MNTEKLITVIIPAFNVSEWIERCLKSVAEQTYTNLEIIVIDDGSTDDTPSIIDQIAENDARIIPVHQKNAGLIAVRERGISMAHGEYVGFVDGDDEIEPDMYERLLNNAVKYDADISHCGIMYCFYDGRKKPMHGTGEIRLFNREEGVRTLLKGQVFEPSLCNKLYKRELLTDSCPDQSVINNEDLLRNSVLFSRCTKSVLEDFCGYHYWRRSESMSNNANSVKIGINLLKARKLILDQVIPAAKGEALDLYMTSAITVYNSLIRNREEDGRKLRNECISLMKQYGSDENLSSGVKKRIKAILKAPLIYNISYRLHILRRNRRIRKQAANLKNQ